MKKMFLSIAVASVTLFAACAVGCGGSEDAELVGVPSAELQAEFEKGRSGYTESMQKSGS